MENKESTNNTLNFIKSLSSSELQIDEDALVSYYRNDESSQQPIIIKILTILGALISCAFMIGFVFLLGIYDSTTSIMFLGLIFIITPLYLATKNLSIFLDTFLLTLYVVGYVFLGYGLIELHLELTIILTIFLISSILTLSFNKNYIITFLSTILTLGSIFVLIHELDLDFILPIFTSIIAIVTILTLVNEARIISLNKHTLQIYQPVKSALLLCFLFLLYRSHIPFDHEASLLNIFFLSSIILPITILFLNVYLLTFVLQKLGIKNKNYRLLIYILTIITLLPTGIQPSLPASILLLLTTFLINYKTGFVLAVIAFLYSIIIFYYDMNISLLNKSIVLISTGLIFFGIYFITSKKLISHDKN